MNDKELDEKMANFIDVLTALAVALTSLVESKTRSPRLRGRN